MKFIGLQREPILVTRLRDARNTPVCGTHESGAQHPYFAFAASPARADLVHWGPTTTENETR
jgi:hypothetical protein